MLKALTLMMNTTAAALLFASTAFADVIEPIPEPATLTMVVIAGVGLYLLNRRGRN